MDDYLGAVFGDGAGFLCLAVGRKPHRDGTGRYQHREWIERAFRWPAESAQARAHITDAAPAGDVYVCPYLLREPKRTKGSAVSRTLIHADVDGGLDTAIVTELGGFVVASGGAADRGHVYIPLSWPVTAAQHQVLCRGLAHKLGGDHKISDNDLLRPAGTLNHKAAADGGDPTSVTLHGPVTGPVDPRVLAEKLGVDITNPDAHTDTPRRPKIDTAEAPVNLDKYPSVVEALADDSGDRSADTYRVIAVCRAAGLTLDESRWVINTRQDLRDRIAERADDDVLAAWLKLDASERAAERIVPPSTAAIDGPELLDEVRDTLGRYVVFPSEAATIAVTLWIAATHALPAWQHATRLAIISPQKRCGKSRLLDIARLLAWNPMSSTDMSAAVIYRSIGDDDTKTPTLFVDEADALFGTKQKADANEDLRGLFNAGFQRDRTVWRCVGPNQTPTEFHTFSMAALAAIKGLPDTIVDRSVRIDLKRRKPGETVERFRLRRDTKPLHALRDKLTAWAREPERLHTMAEAEPVMPDKIEDRAQDAWEPLVAIAEAAGGIWPDLARAAAEDLCGTADDDVSGVQLLDDIHGIFASMPDTTFLRSIQLVSALKDCDESPWRDEDLTPHRLARHLKDFGVKPHQGPGGTARGYYRNHFDDPFARYLRHKPSNRHGQPADQSEQDVNQ